MEIMFIGFRNTTILKIHRNDNFENSNLFFLYFDDINIMRYCITNKKICNLENNN